MRKVKRSEQLFEWALENLYEAFEGFLDLLTGSKARQEEGEGE